MTELRVNLEFACHACHQPVGVTVQCAGSPMNLTAHVLATCAVPCPGCGHVNKLLFEPNGTVHSVLPIHAPRRLPEPSLN